AAALVALGHVEDPAVPAHAGLGIASSQRLEPMILQRLVVDEGQFNRPIVRQVQGPPTRVVVLRQSEFKSASLIEIPLRGTQAEIASGVAAVALQETPVEVEEELLP